MPPPLIEILYLGYQVLTNKDINPFIKLSEKLLVKLRISMVKICKNYNSWIFMVCITKLKVQI